MKGLEGESAVMLFVNFIQLLKLCSEIPEFDYSGLWSPFLGFHSFQFFNQHLILRRIDLSLFQQLSDCAAG